MKIKSYRDLEKIKDNMMVDLTELDSKLITRSIDFLAGLTCKKGNLTKIACHKYLVKIV